MFLCFFCKKVKNIYGKSGDRSDLFVKLLNKIFSKCPAKLLIMFIIKKILQYLARHINICEDQNKINLNEINL